MKSIRNLEPEACRRIGAVELRRLGTQGQLTMWEITFRAQSDHHVLAAETVHIAGPDTRTIAEYAEYWIHRAGLERAGRYQGRSADRLTARVLPG